MSNISNENSLDRSCSWVKEYESLTDLKDFKDNALALFALGLNFGVEDLRAVGADSITDGQDDKKKDRHGLYKYRRPLCCNCTMLL